MKRTLVMLLVLLWASFTLAQTTTVTATVQDPNGQVFANGTYSITFVPGPTASSGYTQNGADFTRMFNGLLNGSGTMTQAVADNSTITPTGSKWAFTFCPNTQSTCTTYITAVSGGTQNISSAVNATVPAIKVSAIGAIIPFAYSDAEIVGPTPGSVYYNITSGTARVWSPSTGWSTLTGAGVTFPLLAPNGSLLAPSYSFANAPNTGIFWDGFNLQIKVGNGNGGIVLNGISIPDVGGNRLQFGGPLQDTGFYREAATVLDLGTGSNNDTSGTMKLTSLVFANTGAYWTNDYIVTTAGEATISAANAIKTWGIYLDKTLTVGSFCWFVSTADNTANLYDYGIYDNAGNLKGHLGATAGTTFSPSNGFTCHATSAGFTLVPGRYYIAETSNCAATCAQLGGPGAYASFNTNTTVVTTSTGGTLPATMTPAADVWTWTTGEPMFVMHP